MWYAELLKDIYNAVDGTFYDAINISHTTPFIFLTNGILGEHCLDLLNKLNYTHLSNICETPHRILDLVAKYYMDGMVTVGLKINTL